MRRDRETQLLLLMPPLTGGPTEPRCYGSPARPVMKREVSRVSAQSAYEKLLHEVVDDIFHSEAEVEAEEKDDKVVKVSLKKSAYMSEDVEQKLQLGGADPYGLLELEDKRWRASADEIRRNYRRLVLQHHPDKKVAVATEVAKDDKAEPHATSEEEGEEEDSAFKLLSTAWDLLGSATRRRAFDSVDYFNDDLPQAFCRGKSFYRTFAGPFARQAKFSEVPNAPSLGNDDTPYLQVVAFYRFWQNFRSWRDFSLLTEQDLCNAEDREERRWMQRQNKNMTDRIKRDELKRVQASHASTDPSDLTPL